MTALPKAAEQGRDETDAVVSETGALEDGHSVPVDELYAKLDRTQARLNDLNRLLPEWLWETDRELRLTHVGPRILDVLKRHPREFLGRLVTEIFGPDMLMSVKRDGHRYRPFGDHEVILVARDGEERIVSIAGLPVYDRCSGEFNGYRGVARDVTTSRAQERALEAAKAAADRANRAKSDFLATMSHELRTPLNAVIGFAEVMRGEHFGALGNPKYQQYAADIVSSARHLSHMIDDILDMAKIKAGRQELHEEFISPEDLVDRAACMLRPKADEAGLALNVIYPDEHVTLWADGYKVVQILANLLSNAVKFTEAGGQIELAATVTPERALSFTVTDTGIGMSAADQIIALEPFGQVHATSPAGRKGSGLGLSIVNSLMQLHKGTLAIDSAPGAGSAITVTLPPDRVHAAP